MINDGLVDVILVNRLVSSLTVVQVTEAAKAGGIQIYEDYISPYRASKVKVINKSRVMNGSSPTE